MSEIFVVLDTSEAVLAGVMFSGNSEGSGISVSPHGTGGGEVFEILGAALPLSTGLTAVEVGIVTNSIGIFVVVLGIGENMVGYSIGIAVVFEILVDDIV